MIYWVWERAGRGRCQSALWIDGCRVATVAPGRSGYYWTVSPAWWDLRGQRRPPSLPFGRARHHQLAQRDARRVVLALLSRPERAITKEPPDVLKTAGGGNLQLKELLCRHP